MARAYLPSVHHIWCLIGVIAELRKRAGGLSPDEVIHLNWNISSQRWDGPADFIPPFICCLSLARPSEPLAFLDGFTGGDQIGMKLAQSESPRGPIRSGRDFNLQQPVLGEAEPLWWNELHIHARFTCMVDYDSAGEDTPFLLFGNVGYVRLDRRFM